MARRKLTLVLSIFILVGCGHHPARAATGPDAGAIQPMADRQGLASAAGKIFPVLLKLVTTLPAAKRLPDDQRAVLIKIQEHVGSGGASLRFDDNPKNFDLDPDQPLRLMRTAIGQDREIFINRTLLNSPEVNIDLRLLLKFYFHEWGHKIQPAPPVALRDRVAQFFEDQVAPYIHEYALDGGGHAYWISVPQREITEELVATPADRPQPTNLILLERDGRFLDLSEDLLREMEKSSSVVRSLWAEVNRWIIGFLDGAGLTIDQLIAAQLNQMDPAAAAAWDTKGRALKFEELRVLEIQDIESADTGDELILNIKAQYTISNHTRSPFKINFEGMESLHIFPVPLRVVARLSKSGVLTLQLGLHPAVDIRSTAEVKSVLREALGDVQQLKVALQSTTPPPANSYLVADQARGFRMFPASAVEPAGVDKWMMTFPIPLDGMNREQNLVGDSVVLGSDRSVYLNRLVQLTKSGASAVTPVSGHITGRGFGIWGRQNGEDKLFSGFENDDPLLMMEGVDAEYPSFNPASLKVQFEYQGQAEVREVRLHFQRMASIMDLSEEPTPRVDQVQWDGVPIPITTNGTIAAKRDYYEVLSASGGELAFLRLADGTQRIMATLKAQWQPIRPLNAREAYMIPLIHPVLVEVMLSNGDVLTHGFSRKGLNCANLLAGG